MSDSTLDRSRLTRPAETKSGGLPAVAVFLVLVLGVGIAIGFLTPSDAWYRSLAKPAFNPPDWVFALVWTAL